MSHVDLKYPSDVEKRKEIDSFKERINLSKKLFDINEETFNSHIFDITLSITQETILREFFCIYMCLCNGYLVEMHSISYQKKNEKNNILNLFLTYRNMIFVLKKLNVYF